MQSDDDNKDKSFRILEAVSPLDVIPESARRRWSVAARERIVREAMAPCANVSAVARAHGLKPQQLFGWRRRAMVDAGLISPQTSDGEADQSRCAAGSNHPA